MISSQKKWLGRKVLTFGQEKEKEEYPVKNGRVLILPDERKSNVELLAIMCGRYAFCANKMGKWGLSLDGRTESFADNYNIAPTATVPVITREGWQLMRWGLVPSWAKEPETKYATFNARADSLIDKPAYRSAWKHGQRCLIPALGYYEWKQIEKWKAPFFITSAVDAPLLFAGLWDYWEGEDKELHSCTIITTGAVGELKDIHDRMPLLLNPDSAKTWLDGTTAEAELILNSIPSVDVQFYPVDPMVGNTRNQGGVLINPLSQDIRQL